MRQRPRETETIVLEVGERLVHHQQAAARVQPVGERQQSIRRDAAPVRVVRIAHDCDTCTLERGHMGHGG